MPRALRTAASALVVGLVAAGCGSSGTAASPAASSALGASTAADAPSLAAQLSEIDGNLVVLDSYVTTSTTTVAGGGTATITTVHHGDDRAKTIVGLRANETITTVTVGDDTWVKADLGFWIRVIDPFGSADGAAKAAPLTDRWVLVTDTDIEDVGANEDRVPLAHPDDTMAQGSTTLDGTTVDVFEDPVALTTVYVSQTEPRLPLKVTGQDGKETVYSAFGVAPAVAAPPAADVIDGRTVLAD